MLFFFFHPLLSFFLEMLVPPLKLLADDPRPPVAGWHSGGHTKSDNSIFYPPLLISTPSNDLLPTPTNPLISPTSRLGSPSQRFWTPHNNPNVTLWQKCSKSCWVCPGSERCPADNAPVVEKMYLVTSTVSWRRIGGWKTMVEIYKCVCNNGQERCGKQMEVVLTTRTPPSKSTSVEPSSLKNLHHSSSSVEPSSLLNSPH